MTDEIIAQYIDSQGGEPQDEERFVWPKSRPVARGHQAAIPLGVQGRQDRHHRLATLLRAGGRKVAPTGLPMLQSVARCRCWVAYSGPLPSPGRRSRGQRRPPAASHATSWKTPPPRLRPRLHTQHLATRAQRRQTPTTVWEVARRIDREAPTVNRATAHRERDPRTRLALPHRVLTHTAALPERALPDPHRTPRPSLALHVLRDHERPAHRRQGGAPRLGVRSPQLCPAKDGCGLRLICAASASRGPPILPATLNATTRPTARHWARNAIACASGHAVGDRRHRPFAVAGRTAVGRDDGSETFRPPAPLAARRGERRRTGGTRRDVGPPPRVRAARRTTAPAVVRAACETCGAVSELETPAA